ncbi:MAG: sigma-70 family RNA polymerase sigma factor [Deltaproteobacteria bacterium]|nr:sigma-70 family RNA polymerase sigma factor [Deltaproteobacteria bacterium]
MTTDLALLLAWADGDPSSGEALFDRYFDALYAFFWSKVQREPEADDLVQVTLLACVERRDRLRPDTNFRAFLFRVARNRLYTHWRDQPRYTTVDPQSDSVAALGPSPSSVLALRGDRRRLIDALRSIPIDAQIILELYYWEKLSGPELAEVFDVPEGTVRGRIRRARTLLHDTLLEQTQSTSVADSTTDGLDKWAAEIRALSIAARGG